MSVASYFNPSEPNDKVTGNFNLNAGEKSAWLIPYSEIQRQLGLKSNIRIGSIISIQLYQMWPNRTGPEYYLYSSTDSKIASKALSNKIVYKRFSIFGLMGQFMGSGITSL